MTLGDDSTDPEIGKLVRQSFCDALVPVLNYGFKSFKLFGKHHFWDFLEKVRLQTHAILQLFSRREVLVNHIHTEHSFCHRICAMKCMHAAA